MPAGKLMLLAVVLDQRLTFSGGAVTIFGKNGLAIGGRVAQGNQRIATLG